MLNAVINSNAANDMNAANAAKTKGARSNKEQLTDAIHFILSNEETPKELRDGILNAITTACPHCFGKDHIAAYLSENGEDANHEN